jgi:hypothetical protein
MVIQHHKRQIANVAQQSLVACSAATTSLTATTKRGYYAGLPDRKAGIRVLEGGNTTVRIEGLVGFPLQVAEID